MAYPTMTNIRGNMLATDDLVRWIGNFPRIYGGLNQATTLGGLTILLEELDYDTLSEIVEYMYRYAD